MTTAASTGFAFERLDGPGGLHLWLDGNQKITAGNGSFDEPAANAFSLLDRVDCPYRTPTCEAACYVQNLEKHQPEIHALYAHNSDTMRNKIIGSNVGRSVWSYHLAEWITEHAQGGFRWHVSGDVFSTLYAEFIANTCANSPRVNHWIYTRSFHLLGPLLPVSTTRGGNLAINLSADRDNYWLARRLGDEHGLRVCYLTVDGEVPADMRPGDVIFPDYALRGIGKRPHAYRQGSPWWKSLTPEQRKSVCPTDSYGKSEQVRCGPCRRCLT